MKLQKISLVFLLFVCANELYADATDDLLQAIKTGNIEMAKEALANGAEVDTVRPSYGHSARSLAQEQVKEFFENNATSIIAAYIATCGLVITALSNNPKNALLSLFAIYFPLPESDPNGIIAKIKKSWIVKLAGSAGLVATAWQSDSIAGLIANSIGTLGLATVIYNLYKLHPQFEIFGLLLKQQAQTVQPNKS